MAVEIILSVLADDRPGLVETLAKIVTDHSGNWIDSSMARLGGEFAGILRVAVADDAVAEFENALAALAKQDITVVVRRNQAVDPPTGPSARLELTGADHPGIVHEISAVLARHGVSIDELRTEIFVGSMSGEKLFSARANIILPESLAVDQLREELERTAQDLMVDIDLAEVDDKLG